MTLGCDPNFSAEAHREAGDALAPSQELREHLDENSDFVVEMQGAVPRLAPAQAETWPTGCLQPLDHNAWTARLAQCSNLKELGIELAWGLHCSFLLFSQSRAGLPRSVHGAKSSAGLFPLPVRFPEGFSNAAHQAGSRIDFQFSISCWLAVACAALNAYYGCAEPVTSRVGGKVHDCALSALRVKIERFLSSETPHLSCFSQVCQELSEKRVSYTGEEISQPHPLTVDQILKSLPPVGHGGAIQVLPFLKGRTKFLVEHPLESLIPLRDRAGVSMSAKVHIAHGQELQVFQLLEQRGVINWVTDETIYRDSSGQLLNGLFGVVKPSKFTPAGEPVLRVIMNLVPANSLLQVISGDIAFLPGAASWLPLTVAAGEELFLSQGDMSAAFYLFELPLGWQQFMGFNYVVDGSQINRPAGQKYRPACRVLPMGWNSSVGIMQQISREILLQKGLPPELELHRARRVPAWFVGAVDMAHDKSCWWQVYLDNFFAAEKTSGTTGKDNAQLQQAAMKAWSSSGVLTAEDKQVLNSPEATELGIRFDGINGLLGCLPGRLMKTMWASIHLLQQNGATKKEMQVILGRWVFVLQFRRAGMGVLSRAWDAVERSWCRPQLRNALVREIQMLMCLGPLLQCDLRCKVDGEITCSDASESGGAAAVARSLAWSGHSLCSRLSDSRRSPIEVPIVVISLFNGVGGAYRIYDLLGLAVMAKISVDTSHEANRTTRSTWPDIDEYHDVNDISFSDVQRWANQYPRALELHLWAGFPCVHLSRVRAFRKNLQGDGSKLFWKLLEVLGWLQQVFGTFATVKFCIENVSSMDEDARREISEHLQVRPVKLDPADTLPFNRPRLAWCSEELYAMEGLELWEESDYVRAYASAPPVSISQWIKPGWSWPGEVEGYKFPTFMKSIPRQEPPPFPAGLQKCDQETIARWQAARFNFPKYQYQSRYLLHQAGHVPRLLEASEREILLGFGPGHTASCRSASEVKRSYSDYEHARLSLCGDSFAISSFAIMGAQMCASLVPRMSPAMIQQHLGLAPGASAHPSIPVPMTRMLAYDEDRGYEGTLDELAMQLGLTVNHTGSDAQSSLRDLDSVVAEWVEYQWARGAPLALISDCLCGLHFFWPEWRGLLRESWRLFKSWRRIEVPTRAPPLTVVLARAFVARAVHLNRLRLAALIAVGFHALLRTGELLELRFCDLEFSEECGVVSLKASKSGLRTGSQEAVALRDPLCLQILDVLFSTTAHHPGDKLWPHSGQAFRLAFKRLVTFFHAETFLFKPYSLRRGGTFAEDSTASAEALWCGATGGWLQLPKRTRQLPPRPQPWLPELLTTGLQQGLRKAGSGDFLWVSDDGLRARHLDDTGNEMHGVLMGSKPLAPCRAGAYFEVTLEEVRPGESPDGLTLGVTATSPDGLAPDDSPATLEHIPETWSLGYDGQMWDCKSGALTQVDWDPRSLAEGDVVGLLVTASEGELLIFRNGSAVCAGPRGIPVTSRKLYAVVDLLGAARADPSSAGLFRLPEGHEVRGWPMPVAVVDGEFLQEPPLKALASGVARHLDIIVGGNKQENGFRAFSEEEPERGCDGSCGRYVSPDEPREEMVQRLAWEIAGCPALLNRPFKDVKKVIDTKVLPAYEEELGEGKSSPQLLNDAIASDFSFLAKVHLISQRLSKSRCSRSLFRYQFDGYRGCDAFHGSELPLLLGVPDDGVTRIGSMEVREKGCTDSMILGDYGDVLS
eukprot:s1320_g7.t1